MSMGQCESGFHSSFILSSPQWPPQLSLALGTLCPLGLSFQNKQALGASSPHYPLHLNLDPTEFLRSVPFFSFICLAFTRPHEQEPTCALKIILEKASFWSDHVSFCCSMSLSGWYGAHFPVAHVSKPVSSFWTPSSFSLTLAGHRSPFPSKGVSPQGQVLCLECGIPQDRHDPSPGRLKVVSQTESGLHAERAIMSQQGLDIGCQMDGAQHRQ